MPNPTGYTLTISGAVSDGNSAVFTVTTGTLPAVGHFVDISGMTPSGFNGDCQLVTDVSATTFTVINDVVGAVSSTINGEAYYSPNTSLLYGSVPQFVRDTDAAEGLNLYYWLSGICRTLDDIDTLSRSKVDFPVIASDSVLGKSSAPGWSQIMDINRCPTYALPWLAQLFGLKLKRDGSLTDDQQRTQWVNAIKSRPNQARGTVANIKQQIISYLADNGYTVTSDQIIIQERIKSNGVSDAYYYNVLLPHSVLPPIPYGPSSDPGSLEGILVGLGKDTYTGLQQTWGYYNSIASGSSYLQTYLQLHQPAGLIVTVGAY